MKTFLLAAIFLLGIGGYFYYTNSSKPNPKEVTEVAPVEDVTPTATTSSQSAPAQIAVFENSDYDFTFKYRIKPYGYSIFENNVDQNIDMGTLFGMTLVRSTDYNNSVQAAAEGTATDGPPSISVYVLSASKVLDLNAWLTGNQMITNCREGEVTATMLASNDAASCLWDGLYPGVTVAMIKDNKIYVLIGTRESMETEGGFSYEKDFNELVASFAVIH